MPRGRGRGVGVVLAALGLALCSSSAVRAADRGSFNSSEPLLNTIWADSVRTAGDMLSAPVRLDPRRCRISLQAIILDGTVRDRCPYIGDQAVVGLTLDVSAPDWPVQRAMLLWYARHQHPDGAIPASPLFDGALVLVDYNAYWLQALYDYVLYSGDVALARAVWPSVLRLLDAYYPAHASGGLLVDDQGLGDYGYFSRHGDVVAYYNAQYALVLRLSATLASWLGDPAAAAAWTARRERLARLFSGAFWDPAVGAYRDTTEDSGTHPQDAQAFAILAGLATPARTASALAYLDGHMWRGYGNTVTDSTAWDGPSVGLGVADRAYPFMSYFEALARFAAGSDDSALSLIRREWGYMAKYGPARSTTWETIGPDGGPPSDQHPSWDAGWSSGAAPALTSMVLGVQPTSPGYRTFTVTPHRGVAWAEGTVVTPHGLLVVSWQLGSGGVPVVHVTAPPGTRWTNPPPGAG